MWVGNYLLYQEVAGTKGEGTIRKKNGWVSTLHKSAHGVSKHRSNSLELTAAVAEIHCLIPCLGLPGLLQVQRDARHSQTVM